MCDTCRHCYWDQSRRRDVARMFSKAIDAIGLDERQRKVIVGLEARCMELSDVELCLFDGVEPVLDEDDGECVCWESAQ